MRISIPIFIYLAISTSHLQAQLVWDWAVQPDTANMCAGLSIVAAQNEHMYLYGAYVGTSFGYNGQAILNSNQDFAFTNTDAFLIKMTASGDIKWINSIGSLLDDFPTKVCIDNEENVIIAGGTDGLGYILVNGDTFPMQTGPNCFVIKFDSSGNHLWNRSWNANWAYEIQADNFGNILCAGNFIGDSMNFDTSVIYNSDPVINNSDIFVLSINSEGNLNWLRGAGGLEYDFLEALAVDPGGNVFIAGGFFSPSITFGLITVNLFPGSSADTYIVKYSPDGNVKWVTVSQGDDAAFIEDITVDSIGNIYFLGYHRDSLRQFGSFGIDSKGLTDYFVGMVTPEGEYKWVKSGGGTDFEFPRAIELDDKNQIYVLGKSASGRIEFDSIVIDTTVPQTLDHYNLFIAKYDEDGNILNAAVPFVDLYIGYYLDIAHIPNSSSFMLTGSFTSSMAFGADTVRSDSECAFIAKLHAFLPDVEPDDPPKGAPVVLIYPNPTSDQLNVLWKNLPDGKYDLMVFDLLGRKIREYVITGPDGDLFLNVQPLSSSAYIIRLRSESGQNIITRKFLKL